MAIASLSLTTSFTIIEILNMLDGKRVVYRDSRTLSNIVALKTLPGSQKNFFREFKSYMQFRLVGSNLEVELNWKSKLKQLVEISENLIKLHEAEYIYGDFRSDVYSFGIIIAKMSTGKPHYDMTNQCMDPFNRPITSYIYNELSRWRIIWVLPYVTPEILMQQAEKALLSEGLTRKIIFTQSTDIYSLEIIMIEISTGSRAFDGHDFENLAVKILYGNMT
ncbi:hypothetical protein C2G38_2219773 [Gigaspora rosea]|uniref:Protein kinase domain-containing protein n=1 Tax=Gigaspora rosea TaxID=44941 RepID=A0A397UDE4_9GLOM|nr:hypothetical protein C2G38_2219773 [Gigaspora rosea]